VSICTGGDVFRVGLIVASELPRNHDTLLLRAVAGGRLMRSVLEDVRRLPQGAFARTIAESDLMNFLQTVYEDSNP
jgi:hypothetical protein